MKRLFIFLAASAALSFFVPQAGAQTYSHRIGVPGFTLGGPAIFISATPDGGSIIDAPFRSPLTGEANLLVKTDAAGTIQWQRLRDHAPGDSGQFIPCGIRALPGGGYFESLRGARYLSSTAELYHIAVRTDSTGAISWSNAYKHASMILLNDGFNLQTAGGDFVIGSLIADTAGADSSYYHLVKIDGAGNLLWSRLYNSFSAPKNYMTDLRLCPNGDYLLGGMRYDPQLAATVAVITRTDSAGNLLWSKKYYGSSMLALTDCIALPGGGVVAAGWSGGSVSTLFLLRSDVAGNPVWAHEFILPEPIAPSELRLHPDGGYAISGSSNGVQLGFLMKTDSAGALQWMREFPTAVLNSFDMDNSVFHCAGFDSYTAGLNLAVLRLDSAGRNGCENDLFPLVSPITVSSLPDTFSAPLSMIAMPYTLPETSPALIDTSGCFPQSAPDLPVAEPVIRIGPLPADKAIFVDCSIALDEAGLYDLSGRLLLRKHLPHEKRFLLDVSQLPDGLYLLRLRSKQGVFSRKITVQR